MFSLYIHIIEEVIVCGAFLHCASPFLGQQFMNSIRIFSTVSNSIMSKRDFVVSHRVPVAAVDHRELVVLVRHILAEVVHRRTAEVLHHTPAAAAAAAVGGEGRVHYWGRTAKRRH